MAFVLSVFFFSSKLSISILHHYSFITRKAQALNPWRQYPYSQKSAWYHARDCFRLHCIITQTSLTGAIFSAEYAPETIWWLG